MSGTLKRYRISCLTEGVILDSDFRSTPPTTCPNNIAHIIIPVTEADVFETNAANQVIIFQGGTNIKFYKFKSFTIPVSPAPKTEFSFTTYTATTPRVFLLTPGNENIGDQVSFYFYPDIPIGTIIADYIGGNTITVSPTVLTAIQNGLCLSLYDGVNKSIIIDCVGISGNVITLEKELNFNFTSGSQVLRYIPRLTNFEIRNTNNVEIGADNLYSVEYPAGLSCKVVYSNRSLTSKIMCFSGAIRFGR